MPLLYWTAMGWGGAMSLKVNDSEVSVDQPIVEALARRALELDEGWGLSSIHEFFVSWESAHASVGGSMEKAREHFERAILFSKGRRPRRGRNTPPRERAQPASGTGDL